MVRFILLITSLMISLGMLAQQNSVTIDGLTYQINDDGVTASFVSTNANNERADILSSVNIGGTDYPVTNIKQDAGSHHGSLMALTIPEGIKTIEQFAFFDSKGLTSIYIPKTVETIGTQAFSQCDNITTITVDPDNPYLDSRNGCNAIMETATDKLLQGCNTTIIPNNTKIIGYGSFRGCAELTLAQVPNSVTSIEGEAFSNCHNLKYVELPNGLTSIAGVAFDYCGGLTTINIPNTVTEIGVDAFRGCLQMKSVVSGILNPFQLEAYAWPHEYPEDCILTVPAGTKSLYEEQGWGDLVFRGGIIEAISGEKTVTINGLTYQINDDGTSASVIGADDHLTSINILSCVTIGNREYPVTKIGSYAFYGHGLSSVIIPNSVTSFEEGAFYSCSNLQDVTLPNSLQSIGVWAFGYCSNIKSINIPEGVERLEHAAFAECNGLTNVALPKSMRVIGDCAFIRCQGLKYIDIPAGVTTIQERAFEDCPNLIYINLPYTITRIEDAAFRGCSNLLGVFSSIENAFEAGTDIFANVNPGCRLAYPTGTRAIYASIGWKNNDNGDEHVDTSTIFGGGTAENRSDLVYVDGIPYQWYENGTAAAVYIGYDFGQTVEIRIPSTVRVRGKDYRVTCIGNSTFGWRYDLEYVLIPEGVTSIAVMSFYADEKMTSIQLPKSLKSVGVECFERTGLRSLTLPENLEEIDAMAFNECWYLTKIISEIKEPFPFGEDAFGALPESCTLTVPAGTRQAYIDAGWTEEVFKGGVLEANNNNASAGQGMRYAVNADGETASLTYASNDIVTARIPEKTTINGTEYTVTGISDYALYAHNKLATVIIPNSVTTIGYGAFSDCPNLSNVTLGNNVQTIGGNAFQFASISSIVIPNSVTTIGENAFNGCVNLESVSMSTNVSSIGNDAFHGCGKLASIDFPNTLTTLSQGICNECESLTKVTIPNSLTGIGQDAFAGCSNLSTIILPATVQSVGTNAFNGCMNLTSMVAKMENPDDCSLGNIFEGTGGASTALTVPAGTRDTYINRGWNENVFRGGIVETASNKEVMSLNYRAAISVYDDAASAVYELTSMETINMEDIKAAIGTESPVIYSIDAEGEKTKAYTLEPNPGFWFNANGKTVASNSDAATLGYAFVDDHIEVYQKQGKAEAGKSYELICYLMNEETQKYVTVTTTVKMAGKPNILKIGDVQGVSGGTRTLRVEMENGDEIAGIQFKLKLPYGIKIDKDKNGKLKAVKGERIENLNFNISEKNDYYQVIIYGIGETATGNHGTIATFTLDIDESVTEGNYSSKLYDITLVKANAERVNAEAASGSISLIGEESNDARLAADVNGDGVVDVADIISTANVILYGKMSGNSSASAKKRGVEEKVLDPQ